jgi:hypothetical protein
VAEVGQQIAGERWEAVRNALIATTLRRTDAAAMMAEQNGQPPRSERG